MVYLPKHRHEQAYQSICSTARQALSQSQQAASSSAVTVLIIVAADPDALCACKILTNLLSVDTIGYRTVPVSGWKDLAAIHRDQVAANEDLRSIIYLNLGSLLDLVEDIELPPRVMLHVLDSHRPYNLGNLFASGPQAEQIQVWDDGDIGNELAEERKAFEAIQVISIHAHLSCCPES